MEPILFPSRGLDGARIALWCCVATVILAVLAGCGPKAPDGPDPLLQPNHTLPPQAIAATATHVAQMKAAAQASEPGARPNGS